MHNAGIKALVVTEITAMPMLLGCLIGQVVLMFFQKLKALHKIVCLFMNSVFNSILRPIYTKQLLPRTVAYNLFPA
jgi:hypothetical protein